MPKLFMAVAALYAILDRRGSPLEYAEAMTDSNQEVTDHLVDRLRGFFDEAGIVELTGLIAFQNLSSKFNSALDVPAQGFCPLPSEPSHSA